jgi:hypothetical protein
LTISATMGAILHEGGSRRDNAQNFCHENLRTES